MNTENYTNQETQFYPTPKHISNKMMGMIDFKKVKSILEPSAGKGDLLIAIREYLKEQNKSKIFSIIDCIEIDNNLRAILKSNRHNVVAYDFLEYESYTQYDLIIMNPPFHDGDKHLLKAIEMCKNGGQICCILNAETIKNPYSVYRKDLAIKLEQYNAKIIYAQNGFADAERKTDVEIAIVYIDIPKVEYSYDYFEKLIAGEDYESIYEKFNDTQLATNDVISNVLKQYNAECKLGLELINQFERLSSLLPDKEYESLSGGFNHKIVSINVVSSESAVNSNKTEMSLQNQYIRELRYKYWRILFNTSELSKLFTKSVKEQLYSDIEKFRSFDFTLANIKTLQLELSQNMTNNVEEAILKQFEKLTYQHSMGCEKNIHYFNGWHTNKAYQINKKIIIPCYSIYDKRGYWNLYKINDELSELEKIFIYLDGGKTSGENYSDIYYRHSSCRSWDGSKIEFKYFTIEGKKKGTVHIWFKDLELLKKFNIFGANKKGWLPESYGKKKYKDMSKEEQEVVDSFEGKNEYEKTCECYSEFTSIGLGNLLMIGVNDDNI